MKIEVKWTGKYLNLCRGKWVLKIDGKDMTDKIPEDLRKSPMYTFGEYKEWFFDGNHMEIFTSYINGLKCLDWIKENKDWLDNITKNKEEQIELYKAFQAEDFRYCSCGGCI